MRLLGRAIALAVSVAVAVAAAVDHHAEAPCDVLIAGGSLASLAAAIAAANASLALSPSAPASVCLLELTDWVGGQATASATSAIDLGSTWVDFPANFPRVFAEGLTTPALGPAGFNPGGCTVSHKCFLPALFVAWADALLASLPNLRVYRSTAVTAVARNASSGRVTSVTAVRRTPTAAHAGGWDRLLSASLPDWYAPADSAWFSKEALSFAVPARGVVIEATEFGDVLLLGGLGVTQGAEEVESAPAPARQSCGQATTVCFYASWDAAPAPSPDPWPRGSDGGRPIGRIATAADLAHVLTWRRSLATKPSDDVSPRLGDTTLINGGFDEANDEDYAYLFVTVEEARASAALGVYAGGVDLTALAIAEARAYATYQSLRGLLPALLPAAAGHWSLNAAAAGTETGLAKMPYLRDTRRAAGGLGGFRLCHEFAAPNGTGPGPVGCGAPGDDGGSAAHIGYHWRDTIALGSYDFDIHRMSSAACTLPAYLVFCYPSCAAGVPYYLPWRALTHAESPNVLMAGKTMAQSFYANAITRLHPSEWSSGAAAGAGAALMAARGWDSAQVYSNISTLQALLVSDVVGLPLAWTGL